MYVCAPGNLADRPSCPPFHNSLHALTLHTFIVFHFVWHFPFVESQVPPRWLMFQTFAGISSFLVSLAEAFRGIGYTSLSQSTSAGPVVSGIQRGVEVHDSAWISLIKKPTTHTHTPCVCERQSHFILPSGFFRVFSLSCHGSGSSFWLGTLDDRTSHISSPCPCPVAAFCVSLLFIL